MRKRPFDLDEVLRRIRAVVRPYPPAALFALAEEGYDSPFEQLVACMLSIRTRDEVMLPLAKRVFARVRTPAALARLGVEELDELIGASRFHQAKARQLHAIASQLVAEHGGALPCDEEVLLSFKGVGPKCANLVLGIACGEARLGVDVHVWRVTNRWGIIESSTPERAQVALEEVIPRKYWVELNRLLVPFGKHICTGRLPHCSTCPVLEFCRQVGVGEHR